MKLRKRICTLALTFILAALCTACTFYSNMSYTFNVTTGDNVKITLDTAKGLKLTQENGEFSVVKDDEEILHGQFATKENYDEFMDLKDSSDIEVIEESKDKNSNDYLFCKVENKEKTQYGFIVWISNSNTGVFIQSLSDQESAKNAFESLTISVE